MNHVPAECGLTRIISGWTSSTDAGLVSPWRTFFVCSTQPGIKGTAASSVAEVPDSTGTNSTRTSPSNPCCWGLVIGPDLPGIHPNRIQPTPIGSLAAQSMGGSETADETEARRRNDRSESLPHGKRILLREPPNLAGALPRTTENGFVLQPRGFVVPASSSSGTGWVLEKEPDSFRPARNHACPPSSCTRTDPGSESGAGQGRCDHWSRLPAAL